ncbi:MAG: DUF3990 domain-containing protein [Lachnospiraceae bacterium]|nr:DUF3990 domain-containing protein [Lachnospiraceae bacterium]
MILYHGTNLDIQSIDLALCRPYKDFGSEDCNFDCKYDIVSGPIADDDMAVLFRQYQNRLISLETLINGMTFRETTNQCSFHTERAVKFLRKVDVLL